MNMLLSIEGCIGCCDSKGPPSSYIGPEAEGVIGAEGGILAALKGGALAQSVADIGMDRAGDLGLALDPDLTH